MKAKFLLLLIVVSLLSACVPVAFVAGATAGGAIVYDNRGFKTMAQDKESQIKAQGRIDIDAQLRGQTHISVSVFNHIMLLVGQAPTAELSQHAYDIVSNLPHIKRIYNEITIQLPISNLTRSHDTWITTKIKTMMIAEKGLKSTQIKVITENSVVYLMGLVTHSQGNLAAQVASRASGVQTVVKLFEYQN